MKPSVAFFTVCGGGEDYEFLLGAIEHHASMGPHLVLDTTPSGKEISFTRLPKTVRWIHEPLYGSGWKTFKLKTAAQRAMTLAKEFCTDILVYLDSDDFYTFNSINDLFPHATNALVYIDYIHWMKDGHPYVFGDTEWHPKIWPASSRVEFMLHPTWTRHPNYNGNPEHHATVKCPHDLPSIRVPGLFRHHLHYAIGLKADDDEVARTTIGGWPNRGTRVSPVSWPPKLTLWRDKGISPSDSFR